ncbi:unnamed protein product [Camellia sinensis]
MNSPRNLHLLLGTLIKLLQTTGQRILHRSGLLRRRGSRITELPSGSPKKPVLKSPTPTRSGGGGGGVVGTKHLGIDILGVPGIEAKGWVRVLVVVVVVELRGGGARGGGRRRNLAGLEGFLAVEIVDLTLLGIAEDVVGFGDLLELGLGFALVARVFVRVPNHGEPTVEGDEQEHKNKNKNTKVEERKGYGVWREKGAAMDHTRVSSMEERREKEGFVSKPTMPQ